MNCSHCGKDIIPEDHCFFSDAGIDPIWFCSRACLRTWLGPDRPLSERIEEARKPRPAPQHVVVEGWQSAHVMGEKWIAWAKTQDWWGKCPWL